MQAERGDRGKRQLQPGEQHHAGAAAQHERDQRAAEREAEQVDAQHTRERVDGGSEHQAEEPHPCDLERQRREARKREQQRHERDARSRGLPGRGNGGGRSRGGDSPGEPRQRPDRHVERAGDVGGARKPQPRHEREPAQRRSRHRAKRVERVQPRERRTHEPAFEVFDQHRERGAHQHGRRQQQQEEHHEAHEPEARAFAAELAIELAEHRLDTAQHGQQPDTQESDSELEQRVGARAVAPPGEGHPEHARPDREAAQERGGDRGDRVQRTSEHVGQLFRPHDLVQQPRAPRGEETQRRPCGQRRGGGGPV